MECLTKQQMTEILRKYTNLKIKDRTVETFLRNGKLTKKEGSGGHGYPVMICVDEVMFENFPDITQEKIDEYLSHITENNENISENIDEISSKERQSNENISCKCDENIDEISRNITKRKNRNHLQERIDFLEKRIKDLEIQIDELRRDKQELLQDKRDLRRQIEDVKKQMS